MINSQRDSDVLEGNRATLENSKDEKIHRWRRCSKGAHFVKEHEIHIPPSKEHPNGLKTKVKAHCANNPSHKDEISYDEIQYITQTYFSQLPGPPTAGVLEFKNADKFDVFIRGWVCYWNEVLKPSDLLDANFIKALIGTESGFRENPPENPHAHGLMQLLHQTFLILQNPKGELTDYLIRIPWNKILDPSANICMGTRWLFQKKKLASHTLQRPATWEEAVIEYKDYWDEVNKGRIPNGIIKLREYYEKLQRG